ncbi:MAG: transglycosylase SLT domain-containing protein [Halieaceae bacterium]|nr:transglycosylase SLT domain-containing protein [Halieaceae bacterium]
MKSTRYRLVNILTLSVICISISLSGEEAESEYDCASAEQYYQRALSHPNENNFRRSFNYKQLLKAAECSAKQGNASRAISQYQFIVELDNNTAGAWSELVFLQMQQVVATLKGLISNSPPRTEQERAIFSQMMSLVEAYGEPNSKENQQTKQDSGNPIILDNTENLWQTITRNLTWIEQNEIPDTEAEIQHYLSDPNYFDTIGKRADRFLGFIISEIRSRDLPIELALVPIVESSLDSRAISPQRAAGLWQIMPATARQYGLTKNRWYDERFDIRISTELALKHFQALNEEFDGNWLLTLAAYNSGSARMQKLLSEDNINNNKWMEVIPNETHQYITRIFALSSILVNPQKFGVKLPQINPLDAFVRVQTNGRIELPLAARLADMKLSTLRSYNPGYLRWAIPRRGYQELLMPPEKADLFTSILSELPQEKRMSGETYEVAYGDSMSKIADKLEVKVSELRSINNVRRNMIKAGEKLLIPGTSYQPD